MESIYFLLQKRENFEIDATRGIIILLMMKIEGNRLVEEKIEIPLDFCSQEKIQKNEGSEIYSEYG